MNMTTFLEIKPKIMYYGTPTLLLSYHERN